MKTLLNVIRWAIGIFLCLSGFAGMFTPDYLLAIFLFLAGVLIIPVTAKLFKKKSLQPPVLAKPAEIAIETGMHAARSPQFSPAANVAANDSPVIKGKSSTDFLDSILGWWQAIKAARSFERAIKAYATPRTSDIAVIQSYLEACQAKEKDFMRKRIVEKYKLFINGENIAIEGPKYLSFYKLFFKGINEEEIIQQINVNKVEAYLFTKVQDDEALDPGEISDVIAFSNSLAVPDYNSAEKIREAFDYYVLNWELDNGLFSGIDADFILNKNEKCIYRSPKCEWFERKSVTTRVSYGGASYRMKITKGLSYRVGSYSVSSSKEIVKISKGNGIINITTKRIIFKNAENATTINISAIIDLEPFSDAVTIYKSKGHPITIETSDAIKLYKYLRSATRSGQLGLKN